MYIVIEGCIGVGKTTLAELICTDICAKAILEATKKHPFIKDFYLKPANYAFQTEMNFILIHYHQLQKAKEAGWFNDVVVSDFYFNKDLIFASLTLTDQGEKRLFTQTFSFLKKRAPVPDLIIYLQANTDLLYKRIHNRGRTFEKNIPLKYLENLNKKYDKLFKRFPADRLIIVDSSEIDWEKKNITKNKVISRLICRVNRKLSTHY